MMPSSSSRTGRNVGEILDDLSSSVCDETGNNSKFKKQARDFMKQVRQNEPNEFQNYFQNGSRELASQLVDQCKDRFFCDWQNGYIWPRDSETILSLIAELLNRMNAYGNEKMRREKRAKSDQEGARKRVCGDIGELSCGEFKHIISYFLDSDNEDETIEVRHRLRPDWSDGESCEDVGDERVRPARPITTLKYSGTNAQHRGQSSPIGQLIERRSLSEQYASADPNPVSTPRRNIQALHHLSPTTMARPFQPNALSSHNVPVVQERLSTDLVAVEEDHQNDTIEQTDDENDPEGHPLPEQVPDASRQSQPPPCDPPLGPTKTFPINFYHFKEDHYDLSASQCARNLRLSFALLNRLAARLHLAAEEERIFDSVSGIHDIIKELKDGIQKSSRISQEESAQHYFVTTDFRGDTHILNGEQCARMLRLVMARLQCLLAEIRVNDEREETFDAGKELQKVLQPLEDRIRQIGQSVVTSLAG